MKARMNKVEMLNIQIFIGWCQDQDLINTFTKKERAFVDSLDKEALDDIQAKYDQWDRLNIYPTWRMVANYYGEVIVKINDFYEANPNISKVFNERNFLKDLRRVVTEIRKYLKA